MMKPGKIHRRVRTPVLAVLAIFAVSGLATTACAQATNTATPPSVFDSSATNPAASDATPPDPTLTKKKKKATAATTEAPAASDQPPVTLDTGKPKTASKLASKPKAAAADSAAPKAMDDATTSSNESAQTNAVPASADAATDVKKKKKTGKQATAKLTANPADAATTDAGTAAAPASPVARKSVRKTAAMTDASVPPEPGSKCKTRSFLVNDYGKDGPTADAKKLLDKDIADWSKTNNLNNVTVGTKNVSCEQFLNFIVFDEWTCTASAKVCWQ